MERLESKNIDFAYLLLTDSTMLIGQKVLNNCPEQHFNTLKKGLWSETASDYSSVALFSIF